MKIIKKSYIDEVLDCFTKEHPANNADPLNTRDGALNNIMIANRKFNGEWSLVELEIAEVLDIVGPWHESEGGEIALVPKTGLLIRSIVDAYNKIEDYDIVNPKCGIKIKYALTNYTSKIYLSIAPINTDDYNSLIDYKEHLIHLDGLHRLVAIGLLFQTGKLPKNFQVQAYIAGI